MSAITVTPPSPEHDPGRLLLAGFEGTVPSAEVRELIREHRLGGVILYGKNCLDAGQVLELTNSLQEEARAAGAEEPLLVDHRLERADVLQEGAHERAHALVVRLLVDLLVAHGVRSGSGSDRAE